MTTTIQTTQPATPSSILPEVISPTTLTQGQRLADPAKVSKLIDRFTTKSAQSASWTVKAIRHANQVIFWTNSEQVAHPVVIVTIRDDRNVLIQFEDGTTRHVRATHLWDRLNTRNGLPCGKDWINRKLAIMASQILESRD